jgi:hypothetical protein
MRLYRFTSFWAALLVVAGLACLTLALTVATLVLAGTVSFGLPLDTAFPGARAVAALFVVLAGVLLGAPSIVAGQLLQIFLDQRRLLRLIHRRLRAIDQREEEREAIRQASSRAGRRPDSVRDFGS